MVSSSPRIGRELIPAVAVTLAFFGVLMFFNFVSLYSLLQLLAAIPLILVLYLGLLGLLGQGPWRTRGVDSAVLILRERYARGELTSEEFSRMMYDLRDSAQ